MPVATPYPIREVCGSSALGWQKLRAGVFREDAVTDTFETVSVPELLVVVVTSGTYRIESARGGRWDSAFYHPGSVGLTAPGCTSVLRWARDGPDPLESVHIRISPDLLVETAEAMSVTGPVLADALSLDDAFVSATGVALGTAVRRSAPRLYAESLAHALAAHLVSRTSPPAVRPPSRGLDERVLRRVVDHIHDHVGDDLRVDELAAVANFSAFHFLRLFRLSTGTTPHRYVVKVRMRRAGELLRRTDRLVSQIAGECGYTSAGQFATAFRREFGCSPIRYRRQT